MPALIKNSQHLDQLLHSYRQMYDKSEKILALFDTDLRVVYTNLFSATIYNTTPEFMLGKQNDSFPLTQSASKFRQEIYSQVIQHQICKEFLSVNHRRIKGYSDILFTLKPIINPENNSLTALELSGVKCNFPLLFKNKAVFKRFENKNNFDIELANETDPHGCSIREVEILFLLFQTRNIDDIAEILAQVYGTPISSSTLYSIIRTKLYPKFEAISLNMLAEAAHKLGYHKRLPMSLFHDLVIETSNL